MHALSNNITDRLGRIARQLLTVVLLTLLILMELPRAIVLTVSSRRWRRKVMNDMLLDAVLAGCCIVGAVAAGFAAAGMYYLVLRL